MVSSVAGSVYSGIIPEPLLRAESTSGKFLLMFFAVAVFAAVFGLILFLASLFKGRRGERVQGMIFVGPAIVLLAVGLVYPAMLTINQSFRGRTGDGDYGLQNYVDMFTQPELLLVLRNTALWVVLVPFLATAVGLLYAILIDRARIEAFAKALIFLPMAISMVGASIIWKFVYDYKAGDRTQIGLLNQILTWLGFDTYNFLLEAPWNTLFLIVILIWVQAGFAMTILSASIKAIPEDMVEAARLDGVGPWQMFRHITVPSIRPSLIVVVTTITIATLKVFDIVQTATGGNFDTSVLAYEFYRQNFVAGNQGLATAIAVVIFLLVTPIVIYNVRQMRKLEAR